MKAGKGRDRSDPPGWGGRLRPARAHYDRWSPTGSSSTIPLNPWRNRAPLCPAGPPRSPPAPPGGHTLRTMLRAIPRLGVWEQPPGLPRRRSPPASRPRRAWAGPPGRWRGAPALTPPVPGPVPAALLRPPRSLAAERLRPTDPGPSTPPACPASPPRRNRCASAAAARPPPRAKPAPASPCRRQPRQAGTERTQPTAGRTSNRNGYPGASTPNARSTPSAASPPCSAPPPGSSPTRSGSPTWGPGGASRGPASPRPRPPPSTPWR